MELPEWLDDANELYEIIRVTHWTPEVIDQQSATLLDLLRAIDGTHRRVEAEQQAKAMRG